MSSSLVTVKVVKVIVKTVTILTYDEGRLRCFLCFSIQACHFDFMTQVRHKKQPPSPQL